MSAHGEAMSTPFLDERHADLERRVDAWSDSVELHGDPRALVRQLGDAGFLRACVPAEYGGLVSVELRDLCVIRNALAYHSSLADTMFAMQGLGSYPVTLAGSEAQKRALLPQVARGDAICAFAITEPEAGSDVSAISTRAIHRDDGGWLLDGEKTFISNAGLADSYVVFARTSADRHGGLSAFLVDGKTPGLEVTPIELIAPHPIGTVRFNECVLPGDAIIGEEGGGFPLAMQTLDFFRASVGAAAVGLAGRALDETLARVKARKQFGKALAEFQATQLALAEMRVDIEASWLLVLQAAHHTDHLREPRPLEAAMAKLYATEAAQRVIDRAVQLHGGSGVVSGAVVERLYREVRALRIYEGTSEIQKLVIAKFLLR
jgi:alkylation response protein AidB-like acyl-CoA dehydrogenase